MFHNLPFSIDMRVTPNKLKKFIEQWRPRWARCGFSPILRINIGLAQIHLTHALRTTGLNDEEKREVFLLLGSLVQTSKRFTTGKLGGFSIGIKRLVFPESKFHGSYGLVSPCTVNK